MRVFLLSVMLFLFCAGCATSQAAKNDGGLPTERTKATYFYNYRSYPPKSDAFSLTQEEIAILEEMARKGDRHAGARLYQHYEYTVGNSELAEQALELVPRGNGIGEYHIATFRYHLPGKYFLLKRQVVELVSLAASGDRKAAERLGEYYYDINQKVAVAFRSYAKGNDSVLPEITQLDAEFKAGNYERVRKRFPTLLEEFMNQMD